MDETINLFFFSVCHRFSSSLKRLSVIKNMEALSVRVSFSLFSRLWFSAMNTVHKLVCNFVRVKLVLLHVFKKNLSPAKTFLH